MSKAAVAFKAGLAAVVGGALTGAAATIAGGTMKTVEAAAAAGALAALAHLFQDNPLRVPAVVVTPLIGTVPIIEEGKAKP